MSKFKKILYKIWIDEAGRWPWLGNVVACSLCFNPENMPSEEFISDLNDSKKLSEKKREKLFWEIISMTTNNPKIFLWVGIVDNYLIDEINIKQANREAMRRSLVELLRKIDNEKIDSVLIDWNDNYDFDELEKKPIFIIWWDWKIAEIWAASIIAKVFRDKLMSQFALLYPDLWIEKHKWYWTKKHREFLIDKSKITTIHRQSYKPVKKILEQKEKLLLHVCCWPDATIPIVDLKEKYDITWFWYDPNIQPKKEYDKRLEAFKKVCKIEKIPYIEGSYDNNNFLKLAKGLENEPEKGKRCFKCYDFRLKKTSELAEELWIKKWTTTLSISPHKNIKDIFKLWIKYSLDEKTKFLDIDFKKNKWFERSIKYTKNHNIYRQNYCWCIFSKNNNN